MTLWVNLTRTWVNGGCIGAFWGACAYRRLCMVVERP